MIEIIAIKRHAVCDLWRDLNLIKMLANHYTLQPLDTNFQRFRAFKWLNEKYAFSLEYHFKRSDDPVFKVDYRAINELNAEWLKILYELKLFHLNYQTFA